MDSALDIQIKRKGEQERKPDSFLKILVCLTLVASMGLFCGYQMGLNESLEKNIELRDYFLQCGQNLNMCHERMNRIEDLIKYKASIEPIPLPMDGTMIPTGCTLSCKYEGEIPEGEWRAE